MKKAIAICLIVVMVLSMNVNVFAAPGAFISSPSGNPAPQIISFDPSDDDCTAKLVITPYAKRDTLPDELKELIEKAYGEIAASKDLTELNSDLAKLAADKNLKGANLAVSDLFDIYAIDCEKHEEHLEFDIVLAADTLKRFVGLLHMNKNGEWELVSNAEVTNDGKHLKFTVETLSPFAIVVDTSNGGSDGPQTGDNSMIHIYVTIMAISAFAILVIVAKNRKQNA
jgi:hypothetical protein